MAQQASRAANDLTVPSNFIQAIRDSGYLSLSTALAELIDNSLQAQATAIEVTIERASPGDWPVIAVQDNGRGMSSAELARCLQFGGSSRFNQRDSLGRFGMGLPAASLSQARHVEVITWQNSARERRVELDVDAIAVGSPVDLRVHRGAVPQTTSGCRVVWRRCDRIEYQRLAWLQRALRRDLGRIFRRFLSSGLSLRINGTRVDALDPMLLSTKIEGRSSELACEPLTFELPTSAGGSSTVTVRFAMLPVDHWHRLDNMSKRRLGIVGGGGVSIVRAGREIAHGWYLMGTKRKENYDDWWRCEIEFEPSLDECFGITMNKQGIRPVPTLREVLEPDLETMAHLLYARVRQAFEDVKFRAATEHSCRVAAKAEGDLPVIRSAGAKRQGLTYRLSSGQLADGSMFSSALRQGVLEVRLNTDHPAFPALYRPLQALSENEPSSLRIAVELMVLAFARSATMTHDKRKQEEFLSTWSATYARMLQKA
jgi:hypothetical protein